MTDEINNKADKFLDKWFRRSEQISPVRIARLKRSGIIQLFADFGFTKGAEIGVYKGDFAKLMVSMIPDLKLLGVDPFKNMPEIEKIAREKLSPLSGVTLVKDISMNAYRDVEDGSLDFIYIDGDHRFDYVMTDLIEWARKVRMGGIISGHDYYRFRKAGVVTAVDAYTQMHKIDDWFLTDERTPSWFWVKKDDSAIH